MARDSLLVLLLVVVGSSAETATADENRAWYERTVSGIAEAVYFAAWPTAKYRSVQIDSVEPLKDGARVTFILSGSSAFDGSDLWVEVIVEIRSGSIDNLSWGRHNGVFPPGTSIGATAELLQQLNRPSTADATPRSYRNEAPSSPVAMICISNPTTATVDYSLTWGGRTESARLDPGKTVMAWASADQSTFRVSFLDRTGAEAAPKTVTFEGATRDEKPGACSDDMTLDFKRSDDQVGLAPRLWIAGFPHPFLAHVVAADKKEAWNCASGYRWYSTSQANSLVCVDEAFGYVGATFVLDEAKQMTKIVEVVPGSPASVAGIVPGSYLITVDGFPTHDMSIDAIASRVRGPVGTVVRLGIENETDGVPITVALTRR